jgi:hypothetical protein
MPLQILSTTHAWWLPANFFMPALCQNPHQSRPCDHIAPCRGESVMPSLLWLALLTVAEQGTTASWESGFGEHQAGVDTDGRVAEPCTL